MQIRNSGGTVLATPLAKTCVNNGAWTQVTYNLAPYAGQTIVLWFNSHDDSYASDPTYTRWDHISVG